MKANDWLIVSRESNIQLNVEGDSHSHVFHDGSSDIGSEKWHTYFLKKISFNIDEAIGKNEFIFIY